MGRDKLEEIGIQEKLDKERKERADKKINRKYGRYGNHDKFRPKRYGK